jgi:hypothetical protein
MKRLLHAAAIVLFVSCCVGLAQAAELVRDLPPGLQIPDGARPGPGFDV